MHARVPDMTDGHVDVVGAQFLQKVNHGGSGGPKVELGKGGVITNSYFGSSGMKLFRDFFEPGRLEKGLGFGNADSPIDI